MGGGGVTTWNLLSSSSNETQTGPVDIFLQPDLWALKPEKKKKKQV